MGFYDQFVRTNASGTHYFDASVITAVPIGDRPPPLAAGLTNRDNVALLTVLALSQLPDAVQDIYLQHERVPGGHRVPR